MCTATRRTLKTKLSCCHLPVTCMDQGCLGRAAGAEQHSNFILYASSYAWLPASWTQRHKQSPLPTDTCSLSWERAHAVNTPSCSPQLRLPRPGAGRNSNPHLADDLAVHSVPHSSHGHPLPTLPLHAAAPDLSPSELGHPSKLYASQMCFLLPHDLKIVCWCLQPETSLPFPPTL